MSEKHVEFYSKNKFQKSVHLKSVPLQARTGPEGSRKLRFPDFTTTAQDGGKVVSLAPLPPRKCSWYSFPLEAESIPRAIVRSEGFLCQ